MTTMLAPAQEESSESLTLIGHFRHPLDPSNRTALCGAKILGVRAFGEYETCAACQRIRHDHLLSTRP